jgi:ATP-dependent RNA helicase DeaD
MTATRFTDLPLSDTLFQALADMGYVQPTPVQAAAIPLVATGRDLMVQSQTGTGKTAAFGIPLVERLDPRSKGVQALALAPTRELAKQVADELNLLGKYNRVRAAAIYGGASFEKQVAETKFAQIVVGTPGRVLDHLGRGTLRLDHLLVLVLDEADEMLSLGFARELDQIMSHVPEKRQTLLFSATIPEDIKRYARRYMHEPEFLSLIEENVAADDVEHIYYMVSGVGRPRDLVRVIEFEQPESAIIFANTRKDSELVARHLKKAGFDAEFLNGDMTQKDREAVMKRTKEKDLRFLVATDIAARGIDISDLSHVINYSLPESPEVYIHRTGRTGRAGASGTAISLIGPREIGVYYYLKRLYHVALTERTVPTQAEIDLRREEERTDTLIREILDGATAVEDEALRTEALRILEREDAVEVVQALLQSFRKGGTRPAAPRIGGILEDAPKPSRVEPGSRPQTLQGLADRVAIVQGEFRGLPARKQPARDVAEAPAVQAPVAAPVVVAAPVAAAVVAPVVAAVVAPVAAPVAAPVVAAAPAPVAAAQPSEVKLFLNIGERDGQDEESLREVLADLAGLWPEDIIELDVRPRHTYVTVAAEYVDDFVEAVTGETLGNRTLRAEVAR